MRTYSITEFHIICRVAGERNSYRAQVGGRAWLGPWRTPIRSAEDDLGKFLAMTARERLAYLDAAPTIGRPMGIAEEASH